MSQYFENDNTIKSQRKKIIIKIKDETFELITDNATFSKDKLDYGTRLLLETITSKKLNGKALDLGCGYGPIGIYLSKKTELKEIDMIDINDRALKLAKENVKNNKLNNINIYKSNIYENVEKKYNYIITNPPIRAGKEVLRNILINAKEHLLEEGELWFVMRKNHGVNSMIKELEKHYNIEIMNKEKGFYIVKCIKEMK